MWWPIFFNFHSSFTTKLSPFVICLHLYLFHYVNVTTDILSDEAMPL